MKIAIIGASGFIGLNLIKRLKKNKNFKLILFSQKEHVIENNKILNINDLYSFPEKHKFDIVFYLASSTIPSTSWENSIDEVEKNLIPFLKFMEHIRDKSVQKIIFLSSAGAIYGSSNELVNENSLTNPFSPYGINKLNIEKYLEYYRRKYYINYEIFRLSNVYGEGQNINKGLGIINTLLENVATNKTTEIYGDGTNYKNYIYIRDVINILELSILNTKSNNIYNLASDFSCDLNNLIQNIQVILNVRCDIVYKDTKISDNVKTLIDNTKLKNQFVGYRFTNFSDSIKLTFAHIVKKRKIINLADND